MKNYILKTNDINSAHLMALATALQSEQTPQAIREGLKTYHELYQAREKFPAATTVGPDRRPVIPPAMAKLARSLTKLAYDFKLNEHLLWVDADNSNTVRMLALSVFGDDSKKFTDFLFNIIEPQLELVNARITSVIPSPTWEVFHVTELQSAMILEQDGDFRVLDWQRRMASGEWKIEDSKATEEKRDFEEANAQIGEEFIRFVHNSPQLQVRLKEVLAKLLEERERNESGHFSN